MKLKPLILLALALGCGLVAMLGVQQMMAKKEAPVQEETVKVLVALTDIDAGKPLDETNVVFKDWPKDQVPANVITTPAEYEKRALRKFAFAGDLILTTKLGEVGEVGAATSIPKGMRITTVPITNVSINAGMVRPGDRVDIVCTYQGQLKGQTVTRTKTVLEYVEVFAIDRQRQGADPGDSSKGAKYETLTLLCTPEQQLIVQHAQKRGVLQMALRRKDDKPDGETKGLFLDDAKFEALETGQGGEDEEKTEMTNTGEQGLNTVLAQAHEENKAKEPPAVDPDQWVIKIYEGGSVREEIVGKPSATTAKDKEKDKPKAAIPAPPKSKSQPQKAKKPTKLPSV